jgi:hypothetical protein
MKIKFSERLLRAAREAVTESKAKTIRIDQPTAMDRLEAIIREIDADGRSGQP